MLKISDNLYCFEDTCNAYVVRRGREAVLIDFGDGGVLEELASIGVEQVSDVLMTHHHRDQGQGLARAVEAGARIWAPHTEQDLFDRVDRHWQAREILNNYNTREDRFSLLEPVPLAGTLKDYARQAFARQLFQVVPTPGHTTGSISLLTELDGQRVAFTGDLIAAAGKVWSMAATQWTYNGAEGVAASIASLVDLKTRAPDILLPSHGEPIDEPGAAIDLLVERLYRLMEYRGQNGRLFSWIAQPYEQATPHLLLNRTAEARSYVLLSRSGKALLIDYGYDLMTGMAAGVDRASRRPWLYTLPMLKSRYGVTKIDVVVPTHYHDDHVAGFNLLREVEGTQVWAGANFADILAHPADYDLPCLWYDPIPVDRAVPLDQPVCWEEYKLTLHELPGHTLYAVAVEFEVDGVRVLATGDQYQGDDGKEWNYVYRNKYRVGDYERTAELYARLHPDLIISGHWAPLWVKPGYFEMLKERGQALTRLHRELLPLDTFHFDAEGFGAWIRPYHTETCGGEPIQFQVQVRNPFAVRAEALVRMIVPVDWQADESEARVWLGPHETDTLAFSFVPPGGVAADRVRIAADLTVGGKRLGQQAEALVTLRPERPTFASPC